MAYSFASRRYLFLAIPWQRWYVGCALCSPMRVENSYRVSRHTWSITGTGRRRTALRLSFRRLNRLCVNTLLPCGPSSGRVGQQITTGSGSSAARSHILSRISLGNWQKHSKVQRVCKSLQSGTGVLCGMLAISMTQGVATFDDDAGAIFGRCIDHLDEFFSRF